MAGNARRLTLLEVIEIFEPLAPPAAARAAKAGASTPVEQALSAVLSEVDAKATFASITQPTLLRLIQRQHGSALWDSAATEAAKAVAAPR